MNINDDLIIEIFFKNDKYLYSRTKQSWLNNLNFIEFWNINELKNYINI